MNRRQVRGPIEPHELRELIEAYHHAKRIGKPLNVAITIHPGLLGEQPADVGLWLQGLLNKLRIWCGRKRFVYACAWSRENYEGFGREHLHLLLHVPKPFRADCEEAIRRWCPGNPKVVKFQAVTSDGAFTYMVKQITTQARYALCGKVTREKVSRHDGSKVGKVLGKRCGTSMNLGSDAREAWRDRPRKGSIQAHTVVAIGPKTTPSDAGRAATAKGGTTPHPPPVPPPGTGPLSPVETLGSPVREHEPDLRPILLKPVPRNSEAGPAKMAPAFTPAVSPPDPSEAERAPAESDAPTSPRNP